MGNITKQLLVTLDYTNIIMLYEFGDDVTIEEIVEKCKSGTHLSWLSSTIHVPPILRLKADLECIKLISHLIVDEILIDAIKTAELYAEDKATEEEFEKAKAIVKQAVSDINKKTDLNDFGFLYVQSAGAVSTLFNYEEYNTLSTVPRQLPNILAWDSVRQNGVYTDVQNDTERTTAEIYVKHMGQSMIDIVNTLLNDKFTVQMLKTMRTSIFSKDAKPYYKKTWE